MHDNTYFGLKMDRFKRFYEESFDKSSTLLYLNALGRLLWLLSRPRRAILLSYNLGLALPFIIPVV